MVIKSSDIIKNLLGFSLILLFILLSLDIFILIFNMLLIFDIILKEFGNFI